ncbi:unnamed protein product [Hapterophycus canaliculatus]
MRLLVFFAGQAIMLLVCLCRPCPAFVLEATRLPCCTCGATTCSARRVAVGTPSRAVASARARRRSLPTFRCGESAGDEEASVIASGVAGAGSCASSGAHASRAPTPGDDPFRSERESVSPMVINALVSVLFKQEKKAADTAAAVLEQRSKNSEWRLTEEEERAVTERLCGVANNLTELRFMLATAVAR